MFACPLQGPAGKRKPPVGTDSDYISGSSRPAGPDSCFARY